MKRKIFKRYRAKKRGGQHYWMGRKLKNKNFGSSYDKDLITISKPCQECRRQVVVGPRTREEHRKPFVCKQCLEKKNFGSHPSSSGIRDMARFREINDMIRRRKESILMGSDTLFPETARKIAMDQLVIECKIKRAELKNRSSSPTTGTAKPSDTLLFEALQGNKKLKQRSEFKKKFGIDLGDIEDLESR